jgi:hypothetical protein
VQLVVAVAEHLPPDAILACGPAEHAPARQQQPVYTRHLSPEQQMCEASR